MSLPRTTPEGGSGPRHVSSLRVHPRKRLALLEEVASDVDLLEDELAARGMPRGRARAEALRRLFPGPAVVREFETDSVAYRRFEARVGGERLAVAERVGLAMIAMCTLVVLAVSLGRLDAFRTGGVFLWGTIAGVALLVANTLQVGFGLWVRQDMGAAARRQAWRVQVGLVVVAISVAALGAATEGYLAAGRMEMSPNPAMGFALVRDVMLLVSMGLGATVIGLVGWLTLTPSLRSHDALEHRIAALFVPRGPALVRDGTTDQTTPDHPDGSPGDDTDGSASAPGRSPYLRKAGA